MRTFVKTLLAVAAVLLIVLWLAGCGGSSGRGRNPVLSGVVNVTQFVVEAGETVAWRGDVTINCETASIAGQLAAQDASGSGAAGGSLNINAQNDIVVTGRLVAADGIAGSSAGDGGAGGAGGSITLASAAGGITLGAAAAAAGRGARLAQAGGCTISSGNGAAGGNGRLGGAGGNGGSLTFHCPEGTLAIHESPGLLQLGDGGAGGQGSFPISEGGAPGVPEQMPNSGGAGGTLTGEIGAFSGPTPQPTGVVYEGRPLQTVVMDDDTIVGGKGGNAGDVEGSAPVTTALGLLRSGLQHIAEADTAQTLPPARFEGARGGDGRQYGGDGGNVTLPSGFGMPAGSGREGFNVIVDGGGGGHALERCALVRGAEALGLVALLPSRGGRGGNARAIGVNGGSGGPGQAGGKGGDATAEGGEGGSAFAWVEGNTIAGEGGNAYAAGGMGGAGGANCTPPGQGGAGGDGGAALAKGGNTGLANQLAKGGNAAALGGNGGRGGDGSPPGGGGKGGNAWAFKGGGSPQGTESARDGVAGEAGSPCGPTTPAYGTTTASSTPSQGIVIETAFVQGTAPRSLAPRLGGPTNPIRAYPGQSMVTSANGRDLWVANENSGIRLYRSFVTGGDRAPDLTLTHTGAVGDTFCPTALWLDTSRDILYAAYRLTRTQPNTNRILAWQGASAIVANRPPDRQIVVSDATEVTALAGDPGAGDRCFTMQFSGTKGFHIGVLDSFSVRQGVAAASRTITGVAWGSYGLAYDYQRDILYVQREDLTNGNHAVAIVPQAATAEGNAAFLTLRGDATGLQAPAGDRGRNDPISLCVFPDANLLFVAAFQGEMLAFANASALTGNVAPTSRRTMMDEMTAAGGWRSQ
ncbi:hypothetical protein LLH23_04810 [bacterium]|nr:hypothetical protein [bacterium]